MHHSAPLSILRHRHPSPPSRRSICHNGRNDTSLDTEALYISPSAVNSACHHSQSPERSPGNRPCCRWHRHRKIIAAVAPSAFVPQHTSPPNFSAADISSFTSTSIDHTIRRRLHPSLCVLTGRKTAPWRLQSFR
ncbi:unnamed protein product [Alternaria burnsii]|nr:unnamed protein product [Alternaria burnsii]